MGRINVTTTQRGDSRPGESIGSVLLPLEPEHVLVPGERVLYRRPKHWVSMIEPFAETAAALASIGLAVTRTPPALSFIVTVAFLLGALFLLRWFLEREWTWSDYAIAGTAILFIVSVKPEIESIILIAVMLFLGRLLLRLTRWAFYEERLVTDRRIIETSGLFGSRIASISLGRITDVTLIRSVVGELADYAELRVETPGQDQALNRIRFLEDPDAFHDAIIAYGID